VTKTLMTFAIEIVVGQNTLFPSTVKYSTGLIANESSTVHNSSMPSRE